MLCPLSDLESSFTVALKDLISHPEKLQQMRQASLEKSKDFDLKKSAVAYEEELVKAAQTGTNSGPYP